MELSFLGPTQKDWFINDNPNIFECEINQLSLEKAKELVPAEFLEAWDWYANPLYAELKRLPHRDPTLKKPRNIKLSRDAGMFIPNYTNLPSKGDSKHRYVLSIHSGSPRYADRDIIERDDGTWIFDYCAQKAETGRKGSSYFNDAMMNNLRDGVPVVVLVKQKDGHYRNYGLAYVEKYNALTDTFALHGPVSMETQGAEFFSLLDYEDMSTESKQILKEWSDEDERKRALVEQVRREAQGKFRKLVFDAYNKRCAVTETDIPETLQAAHIDPYRGKRSQVVNNGVLLRSDIHLLYDSHLLTIHPESKRIVLSNRLKDSEYREYENRVIRTPLADSKKPSEKLLSMHYQEFLAIGA